jgi:hypothetical protein
VKTDNTDINIGRLLGKITEDDGFIPSAKNALRMEAEAPPKVDIKTFGVYAMFRWAYNSPIKRVLNYHAHDFCSEHWSKYITHEQDERNTNTNILGARACRSCAANAVGLSAPIRRAIVVALLRQALPHFRFNP